LSWPIGLILGETEERKRHTINIDRPDRSIVAIVSSEALAVVCEPDVDYMVSGARKEEVTLLVELNLGQSSFMAWN
jgi:hypothetical protein